MSVIYVTEDEAVSDLRTVLARVDAGDEVVIDRPNLRVKLTPAEPVLRRTVGESLAILRKRGNAGVMDEDFARDVRAFRERHPESLDSSKWD